jgi:hypothetical protein
MLRFNGPQFPYCDGLSRRSFLQIGGLAVGGLTLPQLLRAEQHAGTSSNKSVIMVYLSGGISHQDTFDLKMEAPAEIRGEFTPISTNLPGADICELLPKMAQVMDRTITIRSIVGLRDEHSSFQNLTGYTMGEAQREGRPNLGGVISKIAGQVDPVTPAFVDLFPTMQHKPYNSPNAGYLGNGYSSIRADGEDLASMKLRYVNAGQFDERRKLRAQMDEVKKSLDKSSSDGMDIIYQRAFDVLTSSKLVTALDVEREDPKVRERYGKGSPKHLGDGAPMWNDQLLTARRLVEAGVRCVTVAYGFWDTHGGNFNHMRQHLPLFDTGISALIEDIYARGLDKDVTVVVWGEFGRSPKINKDAGRDHWARVSNCLLAGGGMKVGQVIGSTDKIGDSAATRPVHYLDVLATVYHNLGIDPHEFVQDITERPVPILPDSARVIAEAV